MLIFVLQYEHFHLFSKYEKIGNKSFVFNFVLQLGHSLLHVKIHFFPLLSLEIITDEKLQNIVHNINIIV